MNNQPPNTYMALLCKESACSAQCGLMKEISTPISLTEF